MLDHISNNNVYQAKIDEYIKLINRIENKKYTTLIEYNLFYMTDNIKILIFDDGYQNNIINRLIKHISNISQPTLALLSDLQYNRTSYIGIDNVKYNNIFIKNIIDQQNNDNHNSPRKFIIIDKYFGRFVPYNSNENFIDLLFNSSNYNIDLIIRDIAQILSPEQRSLFNIIIINPNIHTYKVRRYYNHYIKNNIPISKQLFINLFKKIHKMKKYMIIDLTKKRIFYF